MRNYFCLAIVALYTFGTVQGQDNSANLEFKPAFVHVVYFWLNEPDNKQDCDAFELAMDTFLEKSEFAHTNFLGTPPKASREVVDDTFTYCLIVTFESAEAQEAYQREQAHVDFIDTAQHLWKKVIVYDAVD